MELILLLVMYGGYLRGVSNGSAIVVDVVVPYDDDVDEDCEIGAGPVAVCGRGALIMPPLPAEYNKSVCVVLVVAGNKPLKYWLLICCAVGIVVVVDGSGVVDVAAAVNRPYGRDCCIFRLAACLIS